MCAGALLLQLPVPVCLPRDQRSAAQLSHLVGHRICSRTTMVWGSSSADDTRPSGVCCMWAGRRVTGQGWKMAADTGVTKPKGHEESHRDGENTGRVMEDNQRRGQLLRVAFVSLMLSCSAFLSFSPHLHTWLCLSLPQCLCFVFLTLSLSLCCPLCCSVGLGRCCPFPSLTLWWRDGLWSEGGDEAVGTFSTGKSTLPSTHYSISWTSFLISCLSSACQLENISCYMKGSVQPN